MQDKGRREGIAATADNNTDRSHSRVHQLPIDVDRLIYIDRLSAMIGGAARVLSSGKRVQKHLVQPTPDCLHNVPTFGILGYHVVSLSSWTRVISMRFD